MRTGYEDEDDEVIQRGRIGRRKARDARFALSIGLIQLDITSGFSRVAHGHGLRSQ